jgi:hypothetical protein
MVTVTMITSVDTYIQFITCQAFLKTLCLHSIVEVSYSRLHNLKVTELGFESREFGIKIYGFTYHAV